MKKLVLLFVLVSSFCFGQQFEVLDSKVIKTWGSSVECQFKRMIGEQDTTVFFSMIFKNLEYRYINDFTSIIKNNQGELDELIMNAEKIQEWNLNNIGKDASFFAGEFYVGNPPKLISEMAKNNKGYIMIRVKDGWTFLTYKAFYEFIDFLKSQKISQINLSD